MRNDRRRAQRRDYGERRRPAGRVVHPASEFPRPWSVYRWLAGEPASTGRVDDLTGFAAGLAGFLAVLQAIDDVTASNLLVAGGALHAVIDFGGAAVGDPACDLVMEWTFFTGDSAAAFRHGLPLDEATWARGRGWALWKALVTIGEEKEGSGNAQAAARRFGWRHSPREIIGLVIADHARSAGR